LAAALELAVLKFNPVFDASLVAFTLAAPLVVTALEFDSDFATAFVDCALVPPFVVALRANPVLTAPLLVGAVELDFNVAPVDMLGVNANPLVAAALKVGGSIASDPALALAAPIVDWLSLVLVVVVVVVVVVADPDLTVGAVPIAAPVDLVAAVVSVATVAASPSPVLVPPLVVAPKENPLLATALVDLVVVAVVVAVAVAVVVTSDPDLAGTLVPTPKEKAPLLLAVLLFALLLAAVDVNGVPFSRGGISLNVGSWLRGLMGGTDACDGRVGICFFSKRKGTSVTAS